MQYADPLTVACPGCGCKTPHSVAKLRALEAECPHCHHSLGEVGERMNAQVNEVADFAVALELALAVEHLDSRIVFSNDEDYGSVKCLNDLIRMVNEKIAVLAITDPVVTAGELIDMAVEMSFPSAKHPSRHLPLHEAFAGHEYLLPRERVHGPRRG